MKPWEDMTNRERAEQTFRDIKRRDIKRREIKRKKKAEYDINSFIVESSMKSVARSRKAKTRGCRSCK